MQLDTFTFLFDIAVIMIMALILGLIANRLGQPAMLGYLFAGMVIGPYSWSRLISSTDEIESLAKVGVSLLLFVVGLEFSPRKLRNIWRPSALSGSFEMLMMFLLGTVTGLLLGWTLLEAAFLGAMLMMSSTIIIIKILGETGQLDTLHGQLLIGRLIIEDIAAIVVITTISSMTSDVEDLWLRFLPVAVGIIFLVIVIVLGRRIFPWVIEKVSKAHSKELFLLTVFGICIGVAVVSETFGLSLALGAFMAGVILSESEHHLDILSQIRPLKDVFLIIFFVSVGMTIDPEFFFTNPFHIVVVIAVLMAGKFVANNITTRLMGYHPKTSVLVGTSMMQIGEFSFIIATLGVEAGILLTEPSVYSEVYSVIVTAALVTMVFTPYAIKSGPGFYRWLAEHNIVSVRPEDEEVGRLDKERLERLARKEKHGSHILILGCAEVVQETMACLNVVGRHYTVVDYDPRKIALMREQGVDAVYGDAANDDVLHWAGVDYATLIIVAVSDTIDAENAINHCHNINPDAYVIARAYGIFDRDRVGAFADDVIISEEVAGRRMAWHVLRDLGLETEAIKQDIKIAHREMVQKERSEKTELESPPQGQSGGT
jgi:CPA2 family monovalent cation:H+ antiporter-2